MKKTLLATALGALGIAFAFSVNAQQDAEPRDTFGAMFGQIKPVAATSIETPAAKLGRALFWDERLSVNGKIACATCHMPEDGSSDRRQFSIDARDKPTSRHSQPIYNSTLQTAGLRWTGDRPTAAAQAEGSMTGSMGFETRDLALANLKKHYERPLHN
jgi:cytochrome c peroxidase